MSYSVNLYLDSAVSKKKFQSIQENYTDKNSKNKNDVSKIIKEKSLQIFLYLRFNKNTIKIYTQRNCTQKSWNESKQRVNPNYFKSGAVEINTYLDRLVRTVSNLHEKNNNENKRTSKEEIMDIVLQFNNMDLIKEKMTFENAFEEFINTSTLINQPSTIVKYKTTLKHLKNFSLAIKSKLKFENIDIKFYDELINYFMTSLLLTNNTVSKYIRTLRVFLNFANKRGYNTKLDYKSFKAKESEGHVFALTFEELFKIYNHAFIEERLERVKDTFCFACFTGLRFSDVLNLKRDNIENNRLTIVSKKDRKNQIISLISFALEILNKYSNCEKPLPVISSQKTNEYLKEIGIQLCIDKPVEIIKFRGSERIEKVVPKYEILTFHLARKTFITNSLILGMSESEVKEVSGHKKDNSFKKYVAFSKDYMSEKINFTWSESNIQRFRK